MYVLPSKNQVLNQLANMWPDVQKLGKSAQIAHVQKITILLVSVYDRYICKLYLLH